MRLSGVLDDKSSHISFLSVNDANESNVDIISSLVMNYYTHRASMCAGHPSFTTSSKRKLLLALLIKGYFKSLIEKNK